MIQIGKFRQRVSIKAPVLPRDKNAFGEALKNEAAVQDRWAEVTTLTGRELVDAQQIVPEVTHSIRLRWMLVTPKQTVRFHGDEYVIEAVLDPENRRATLTLLCKQQRAGNKR